MGKEGLHTWFESARRERRDREVSRAQCRRGAVKERDASILFALCTQ